MVPGRADSAAHRVRQALRVRMSPNSRDENPPPKLVEHRDGIVVRVLASRAQSDHVDVALIHVVFSTRIAGLAVLNVICGPLPPDLSQDPKAWRRRASMAAESKSPATPE